MSKPQIGKILRIWKYLRASGLINTEGEFSDSLKALEGDLEAKPSYVPTLKDALEELMGCVYLHGHYDGQDAAEEDGLDNAEEDFSRDPEKAWKQSSLRAYCLQNLR